MPYAVLPVNMAAASGVARTTMSAFHQDPHWALLWGNMPLEEIIDGNTRRQPRNLITSRERKRHQMVVETETGEVVGYARWLVPDKLQRDDKDGRAVFWPEAQIPEPTPELREKYEAEWKTATKDGHALGSNAEMIRELSVKLDEEDRRIQKGEVFLELEYLTTAPAHQNKGVGGLLVQSGLQQADAVGVDALVMASTGRGRKLYEKHGFEHVSCIVQDDSKWGGSATGSENHWYIRRQAKLEAS